MTFTTWKHGDTRFLAFPNGWGVMVLDENGNNYGSHYDVESFRKAQRNGDDVAVPIGKGALMMRVIS